MKLITSIDDATGLVGSELGVSDWLEIDQQRVNDFAAVTGDHQWIHLDVERAKNESPYGAPIAHGFLTLSLIPALSKDNFRVQNAQLVINYGLNKVRFLSAVPVGSRIRVRRSAVTRIPASAGRTAPRASTPTSNSRASCCRSATRRRRDGLDQHPG